MSESARIRVLIVDDEPLARERIHEILEQHPEVEVTGECTNGREAIEAVNETLPDLIFLDIQMPETDGFAVIEALPQTACLASYS